MTQPALPAIKDFKLTGIILCVIGVISLITPLIAGIAVVYMIGAFLLLGGILYVLQSMQVGDVAGKTFHVILGALIMLGGLSLLFHPLYGLELLTLIMAVFFVFEGVWKIIMSLGIRPAAGWGRILFSGVISLLLGGLIWGQWPVSGMWAVGTLVGVDFLLTGFFLISLANQSTGGNSGPSDTIDV
ncbi:HdeD family acid-resistance protein [Gimesia maris]|uniref:HdeD family acid-resistance protein n=1 Tax=Gimesia maris TaxID=122 RepID=UPI0030DD3432|tara:strand:- start:242697 stop:243254 length:558 start_codon:yes stop_codon:yes gene_type:complete